MANRKWTPSEVERLKQFYPRFSGGTLEIVFRRPVEQIYRKANQLGLKKSEEYLASPLACRLRHGDQVGKKTQFKQGHEPFNKGRKGWQAGGRAPETQFKKGQRPKTWVPIGTEVADRDGYLKRKIKDDTTPGQSRFNWKYVHVLLWEEHTGTEIPKGHAVVFKDGNKQNLCIENLELLSRGELMRRNTIHRYPPELKQAIRLVGKLKRTIEAKENEKQD